MSPYFHLASLGVIVIFVFAKDQVEAAEVALNVIPDLLGFTIGAMAIVIAFSAAPIFSLIAEDGHSESFFMKLAAGLVHFVVAQVLALVLGVIAKLTKAGWLEPIVLFFLLYGILVAFAAALQLFHTAMIYNAAARPQVVPRKPVRVRRTKEKRA